MNNTPTTAEYLESLQNDLEKITSTLNLQEGTKFTDIAQMTESGEISKGFYKVASIQERDDIENPEEGNICLVYSNTQAPISNPPLIGTYTFPNTVTFASAISDEKYLSMGYTIRIGRKYYTKSVDITLNDTSCEILIVDEVEEEEYTINYTSNDGITYTKTDGIDNYTLPDVEWGVEPFDIECSKFMLSGEISFNGIYVYENDDWEYLNIDINTTAGKILQGNKAYTSNGTITGTLVNDIYKVSSIQERNNLQNVQDGDICLVYSGIQTPPISYPPVAGTYIFPDTVTFDSAISSYYSLDIEKLEEGYMSITIDLNGSQCAVVISGTSTINVMYTTNDGLIYTKTSGSNEFTLPDGDFNWELYDFDTECTKFMLLDTTNFAGIYEYKNSSWSYLYINSDVTSNTLLSGIKAYSNNGNITGTLGDTVSSNFNDTISKLYGIAQSYYNTLTPTVAPADSTTLYRNSNINIIPCKCDGTPLLDTSNVTNMLRMFESCKALTTIPLLDTSNVTNMKSIFSYCSALTTIPLLDTSNVTDMYGMFESCKALTTIPLLNTSNVNDLRFMFSHCPSLSDQSLNNILQMCINATSYTNTKALSFLGFLSSDYPASRIQALSNYTAFTNAGWTIGY